MYKQTNILLPIIGTC